MMTPTPDPTEDALALVLAHGRNALAEARRLAAEEREKEQPGHWELVRREVERLSGRDRSEAPVSFRRTGVEG